MANSCTDRTPRRHLAQSRSKSPYLPRKPPHARGGSPASLLLSSPSPSFPTHRYEEQPTTRSTGFIRGARPYPGRASAPRRLSPLPGTLFPQIFMVHPVPGRLCSNVTSPTLPLHPAPLPHTKSLHPARLSLFIPWSTYFPAHNLLTYYLHSISLPSLGGELPEGRPFTCLIH